jgi:glycolate oxidase
MTGAYVSVDYIIESIPHAEAHGPTYAELKAQYTPPLMPDYRNPGWTMVCEANHQGYSVISGK